VADELPGGRTPLHHPSGPETCQAGRVTPLLVFDVNETLLDLGALRPAFRDAIGTDAPMGEWFARMLHGSLVANHTNSYRPFDLIGVEALMVVAQKLGIDLDIDRAAAVVGGMRTLPPHEEVPGVLARLAAAGTRMVALTNSSHDAAVAQIENAGLSAYFEDVLSVDMIRRFKPAPEVYLAAAARLGVEIDEMLMVAAHDWDIIGARSVGCPGAFIARPGVVWGIPADPPDIIGRDLTVLEELRLP